MTSTCHEESMSSTIGKVLDPFLHQLGSLPAEQLYGVIVIATLVICHLVLGTGKQTDIAVPPRAASSATMTASTTETKQPRWHIFTYVNYLVVAAFVASIVHFSRNTETYLRDDQQITLLQLVGWWSILLLYFFGFFGVSYVHKILLDDASTEASPMAKSVASVKKEKDIPFSAPSGLRDSNKGSSSTRNVQNAPSNLDELSDDEVAHLVLEDVIRDKDLEARLDKFRAVEVRRLTVEKKLKALGIQGALDGLPSTPSLDYGRVFGANCEIVIGYVPIPVGVVGPLTLNGQPVYIPMATTEGCLVASTNRGAKAISEGTGATATILRDGITRAPCLRMESATEAAQLKLWCEQPQNFALLKKAFESTTSFGKLKSCSVTVAGKNVYVRLVCFSGDAMGMNMVSKGSSAVIQLLKQLFPSMTLEAISGNMCTDKKPAAINWLEGRGKSVVVEATIPQEVVRKTLKTSVKDIVRTNLNKNLIGSAMAGAIGGFNAHAANIVTAVFLATGQDPAQNVESSNCITLMEETTEGDLWISCTMPSIEVGTVGGGTSLPAQSSCLKVIGCKGGGKNHPGENAQQLAQVVAAATMSGELSLMAALASDTLVQAHMQHNRKPNPAKCG